jgi:copper chaperone CopZ
MKASIFVQNLKCGGCAKTITTKLSKLNNVWDVVIDIDSAMVSFAYSSLDDALMVKEKLKALGYPSVDSKNALGDKAKSFISCATGRFS